MPPEGDHRRLGRPAADVDDHVAERLVDRQPGADGRGHGLLDQVGAVGARAPGRLLDGPPLHLGDGGRDADQHPGPVEPGDPGSLQQQPDHPLGDVEVGDGTLAQRPHGHDVARRPADHLPRFVAHGQHVLGPGVEGDDRRLVEDDAPAARVDEGVGGAEIDGQVSSQSRLLPVSGRRSARLRRRWWPGRPGTRDRAAPTPAADIRTGG